ncbi:NAD-dependent epimerase/dehydratase family protein [Alteribacillus persepolensis]|uniref:NAD-dependent epimerase/dehydratase family protein n=1 Tax=Alteribacillus persepolensis TaxID=568899 RepID=UPI001C31D61E|nr:NAD-dependent epimerase/dehydratase family protein [Alteribacillus persepolensis]
MKESINQIKNETVFITGGAGFIGSTLAGRLLSDNKVVIYDNLKRNTIKNMPFAKHKNLTLINGDILDLPYLKKSMEGSTYVIHCAGITGVDTVIKSPVSTMRVNIIGSYNVLEAASHLNNCKRVICFSTSEVFGKVAFQSEESSSAVLGAVGEARWTYAVSKLSVEHFAYAYFKEKNVPTVTVRPFNVYGPGQTGEGALRTFIMRALNNEDIVVHGDGTQIRAWCYVDDMIEAVIRCMIFPEAVGESFNIGNAKTITTIYGMANIVIRVLQSQSKIVHVPKTSADIELRIPKTEKAEKLIDFKAKTDLEEGIKKTAEFFRRGSQ